ncbi:hypothetical protein D5282_18525 [bacterium 1xD8-48]|nr:hypothetical protein [bacterium 1xD8-48]
MDLLHKRYASPFSFLDSLIFTGQFASFVVFLLNKVEEEKSDSMAWEFFLHKVYDKSFSEFKEELSARAEKTGVMDEAKKEEIIARSEDILKGFCLG